MWASVPLSADIDPEAKNFNGFSALRWTMAEMWNAYEAREELQNTG
jgi:hypothetical protein